MADRVRRGDSVAIKIKPYRGEAVRGVVDVVLTKKASHPRGVKVRLRDGRVGRVVEGSTGPEDGGREGRLHGIFSVLACAAGGAWLLGAWR